MRPEVTLNRKGRLKKGKWKKICAHHLELTGQGALSWPEY